MVKDHSDSEKGLTARVLLYAPSHRQDSTYHSLCYTSHGALARTKIAQWVRNRKKDRETKRENKRDREAEKERETEEREGKRERKKERESMRGTRGRQRNREGEGDSETE